MKKHLLTLIGLLISILTFSQVVLSEKTSKLVNALQGKPICISEGDGWAGTFPQFNDYINFKYTATTKELISLLDSKDKYLRIYAFRALTEKKEYDVYPYMLKNISIDDTLIFLNLDMGGPRKISDVLIDYGKSYIPKEKQWYFDSLVIFSNNLFNYKYQALSHNYSKIFQKALTNVQYIRLLWFSWDSLKIIEPYALDYLYLKDNNKTDSLIKKTLQFSYELNYYNNVYETRWNPYDDCIERDTALKLNEKMINLISRTDQLYARKITLFHFEQRIDPYYLSMLLDYNDSLIDKRINEILFESSNPKLYARALEIYKNKKDKNAVNKLKHDIKDFKKENIWSKEAIRLFRNEQKKNN